MSLQCTCTCFVSKVDRVVGLGPGSHPFIPIYGIVLLRSLSERPEKIMTRTLNSQYAKPSPKNAGSIFCASILVMAPSDKQRSTTNPRPQNGGLPLVSVGFALFQGEEFATTAGR